MASKYQEKVKKQFENEGYLMIKLAKTNINGIADFIAIKEGAKSILIECKEKKDTIKALQIFQNQKISKSYGCLFEVWQDGNGLLEIKEFENNTDLF